MLLLYFCSSFSFVHYRELFFVFLASSFFFFFFNNILLLLIKKKKKVLIFLATNLDWPLHQLDTKFVFLHGDLLDEECMEQPLSRYGLQAKESVIWKAVTKSLVW